MYSSNKFILYTLEKTVVFSFQFKQTEIKFFLYSFSIVPIDLLFPKAVTIRCKKKKLSIVKNCFFFFKFILYGEFPLWFPFFPCKKMFGQGTYSKFFRNEISKHNHLHTFWFIT